MYRGKSVAVVVPAYNEAGLVGEVLDSIPGYVDRVYAVDDCSTDRTWTEIREQVDRSVDDERALRTDGGVARNVTETSTDLGDDETDKSGPRVIPIRHRTNRGVGAAIKTGYRHAVRDRMDVTAVINGDGQMNPAILDRFVEPIAEGEADYTKGNRLRSRNRRAEMSTWRLAGNAILTFLTKVASGYWKMTDPQNGYTAISLDALEALDLDALYDGYGFLNDLLVTLNVRGFRVADVEMEAVYGEEESGIRYSSFVPTLSLLLLQGFLWRLKAKYFVTDFHPLVFLYSLGVGGSLLGVGYALWAAPKNAVLAAGLAVLILLLSSALVTLAMVLDMRYNEELHAEFSY